MARALSLMCEVALGLTTYYKHPGGLSINNNLSVNGLVA